MRVDSNVALRLLGFAALLGVLGDLLLRVEPWGINALLAALALGIGFMLLTRRMQLSFRGTAWWLLTAVPAFAAVLVWRASPPLILLAALGAIIAFVGAALSAHRRPLHESGTWDVAAEGVATALHAWFGAIPLLHDVTRAHIAWKPWDSRFGAILRGAVLAIPPLIVFGALFMAADAAFARMITDLIRIDFELVIGHVALAGLFTWLAAGYLYWVVLNDGSRVPRHDAIGLRTGTLEVGIMLGTVIVLFVAFIGVQSAYLFGGESLVQATTGLTYAEYARRGFFELVVAAFLLLPLLLVALWLVRAESPAGRRTVRIMATALEVMIFLIMGSALYRMRLYQEAYGLTHLRFYTTAFMAWLAVVFVILAVTVLRDRPRHFIGAVVATALASVLLLAAVNPDARIVATNAARAHGGAEFDRDYVYRELSADAVPALVASLPQLTHADRCATAHWLVERWGAGEHAGGAGDWRTWNYARSKAQRVVQDNEAALRRLACPPTG